MLPEVGKYLTLVAGELAQPLMKKELVKGAVGCPGNDHKWPAQKSYRRLWLQQAYQSLGSHHLSEGCAGRNFCASLSLG